MDFITDLLSSKGYDRFTKMAHFVPCTKTINSQETTDLVMREVFRHHGLPDDIIIDRGPQFISTFGNTCLDSSKLIVKSLQAIIQRLMVKPNVPIKPWNNILVASSIINRCLSALDNASPPKNLEEPYCVGSSTSNPRNSYCSFLSFTSCSSNP